MSDEPKHRDEEWLREEYLKKERTVSDIANMCGCSGTTVRRWLKKHSIKIRRANPPIPDNLTDPEWLKKQYVEKGRTTYEIADECGCSQKTVRNWMKQYGISCRSSPNPEPLTGKNHPHWNGGSKPYGPGWNHSKKRQVRQRDGHECVDCGTTQAEHKAEHDEKLHVHHLIKARDVDDAEERNAPENLITLCRDCHQRWERLSEAGIRPQIDGITAD